MCSSGSLQISSLPDWPPGFFLPELDNLQPFMSLLMVDEIFGLSRYQIQLGTELMKGHLVLRIPTMKSVSGTPILKLL